MSKSKQFFNVRPVDSALDDLFDHIQSLERVDSLPPHEALGRIIHEEPISPVDLPEFNRSAMDGYAVRAADTFGASDSLPAYLKLTGHINMGEVPDITLSPGEAAAIHTGGMLPDGADAVVMIERTQQVSDSEVEVLSSVAVGGNVIQRGEDVRNGSPILPKGHRIRPQDIGGLLAAGIKTVTVSGRLLVGILSSGDELVDAYAEPQLGQIRDINSHILATLFVEAGADVIRLGIANDTHESLLALATSGYEKCDVLVISAGSSVSVRDLTSETIAALGSPGILQHGLAVKPGKPTIIAACDGKPVFGLPGNPVSALLVARQIITPTLRYLTGERKQLETTMSAVLTQNVSSTTGREDSIPVKLVDAGDTMQAVPIFGKSNLIFTLLQADGLIHIPLNTSGYKAGTQVEIRLF